MRRYKIPIQLTRILPEDSTAVQEAPGLWYIFSEKDGVEEWAEIRRTEWEMPEWMIQESMPDAIEYWRAWCPWGKPGEKVPVEGDVLYVKDTRVVRQGDDWFWLIDVSPVGPPVITET